MDGAFGLAHETFGWLGERAETLLSHCAGVAARRAYRRGRLLVNSFRRLRAQLDAALLAARCGVPWTARRRRQTPTARFLEAPGP